jgi:hypothetical protein
MKRITIPHLEPGEDESIDTVIGPEVDYDETLLGRVYSVSVGDPDLDYDTALAKAQAGEGN